MSQRHPLAGAPQAQTEAAALFARTQERKVEPLGDPNTSQPINVPTLKEGFEHSSLTSVLGHEVNEAPPDLDAGFGPRLVILHHFVTGPTTPTGGAERAAFERGQVIWGSQLIGDDLMKKAQDGDPAAIAELRRYVNSGAIREANKSEARYQSVTFLEGEQAIGSELERTQARVAQVEDENSKMRKVIEALNLDPNASEGEIEAQVARLREAQAAPTTGTATGTEGGEGIKAPVITPPTGETPPAKF